ncbi:MAG: amidohydrolase family protein [Planctomycetota bacterium]|nr:amidohydrolase family protein [Planctomycetota bacterium]MDA1179643.1 amidohydrolase family protein [Planctomycetota bacterium]
MPDCWAATARWVFPVAQAPISDGIVVVRNGLIESVGTRVPSVTVHDFGNSVLLPALVNAHTHLEFSDLLAPIPRRDDTFASWIEAVVNCRRARLTPGDGLSNANSFGRIATGCAELLAGGCGYVGDIRVQADEEGPLPIAGTAFHEILGLRSTQADATWQRFLGILHHATAVTSWRSGISPHTPYTVRQDLFDRAIQYAIARDMPVAMHLAESRDEMQLLACHDGPLRTLFEAWDVWDGTAFATGSRPLDYLRQLAHVSHALVIHGNYLDSQEIEFLANHRASMSVIHCPRTHAFFKHDQNPLCQLVKSGVRVAIGTDSRASNPDISIFDELRYLYQANTGLPPAQILQMATTHATAALGLDGSGTLSPGQPANLTAIAIPSNSDRDPYETLFSSEAFVQQVFWRGQSLWKH